MVSTARNNTYAAPVVSFPVFDDYRLLLIEWIERIDRGATRKLVAPVTAAQRQLRRVRKSARHAKLAEFLEHTLLTLEAEEVEGARYILLTALATFGWPSAFAQTL